MEHRRQQLIERRRHVGHTQESLAQALGVTTTTVSSWERGVREPGTRHRRHLAVKLGVDLAELDRLLDPSAPPAINGHRVPVWLSHYESLVQAAGLLEQVETVAIPGLFQTRAYATAIEPLNPRPLTDEQVHEAVERRLARQAVLEREPDPLYVSVVLAEHVLHNVTGGRDIMADQLDQLDELTYRPNVEIRLLPGDGRAFCARGGFELLATSESTAPFLAVTIDIDGPRYEEREHAIATAQAMFDHLRSVALTTAETKSRIRELQRSYR